MIDAILGYPKCGNTWMYVLLHKAREFDPTVLKTVGYAFTHFMPKFNEESYRSMQLDFGYYRDKSVVMLIRDPRDALVSLYMQKVHREIPPLYNGTIDDMVRDEVYGIRKFVKYYRLFREAEEKNVFKRVLWVAYEEMINNTYEAFKRVVEFGGYNLSPDKIQNCVDFASFGNMKKLEETNTLRIPSMAPSLNNNPNACKVRRGEVGGYVNYLSPITISYIDSIVSKGVE